MLKIPVVFIATASKAITCELVRVPQVGEYVEVFVGNNVVLAGYVAEVKNHINATRINASFQRCEVWINENAN